MRIVLAVEAILIGAAGIARWNADGWATYRSPQDSFDKGAYVLNPDPKDCLVEFSADAAALDVILTSIGVIRWTQPL